MRHFRAGKADIKRYLTLEVLGSNQIYRESYFPGNSRYYLLRALSPLIVMSAANFTRELDF